MKVFLLQFFLLTDHMQEEDLSVSSDRNVHKVQVICLISKLIHIEVDQQLILTSSTFLSCIFGHENISKTIRPLALSHMQA